MANKTFNDTTVSKAGDSINKIIYTNKINLWQAALKAEYDSLGTKFGKVNSTFGGKGTNTGNLLYFYHPDHLGSSSLITDASGNVTQHIEYVPYGEVFIEEKNASWRTPYKFNAKELDEETGLYYYGARYYDPKTSVWISVDPLAEKYAGMSSYNYCANNPLIFIDPDGKGYLKYDKSRIMLLPDGKVILRLENLHNPTKNNFMAYNNNSRNWEEGKIGVMPLVGVVFLTSERKQNDNYVSYSSDYYEKGGGENYTSTIKTGSQKNDGTTDGRYKTREINTSTPSSPGVVKGGKGMLALDAIVFALDAGLNILIWHDKNTIEKHKEILKKAIEDVNTASKLGYIPPKYQNKEDLVSITNVVLQGEQSTKNKEIQKIGNRIYNEISLKRE